ncbi:MAG: M1 family aminopeptidase [Ignavibacteria bacterium]|jgi:hypothetical protein
MSITEDENLMRRFDFSTSHKPIRCKCNFIFWLILLCNFAFAQSPVVDVSVRDKMAQEKAKHYEQLLLAEQQMTSNQEAYDVKYYSLDLIPNPATSVLNGVVEIVVEVLTPTLNQVELNFWDGMSITEIYDSNFPAAQLNYNRSNDLLVIDLNHQYLQGEQFGIKVAYNGRPQESQYYSFFFSMYDGEPMIWTISSVFGARAWWPCKDIPSDKPDSVDIHVTVPDNFIVASNGALRQTTTAGNNSIYWWHEKYPIATYLVFLSIYPYDVHYDNYLYNNDSDTMQIHFYSFPGNYDQYYQINEKVKNMISCYADLFGEYPFVDEKYGQADFLWGGGMEHQTCTSYGTWNESLFAHEIAHQWWGDMITCDNFQHIWLNEGFASYAEALWFEYAYPQFTASHYQTTYQMYLGPGTVIVENPEFENIFDSGLSYNKGSWVLHMLRHIVGDGVFFNILQAYYNSPEHKYGTATTEDFQLLCEQLSGMDLGKFFHQWIYEEGYPQYFHFWDWNQTGSDYEINLEIRQEQSNYIFWMPIDVTVTTVSGETTFVVWDSLQSQLFQLTVSSEPINIELDKDDWILKTIRETFTNPTFDNGILLVNGVSFDVYGSEIRDAYENRAFWGSSEISFWDCFDTPQDGYPSTLPEPIGHGKISAETLGLFSTVIWVGNNYAGDLGRWQQAAILPYLEAGGNVILLTRKGRDYISTELQQYLGITWAEGVLNNIQNCAAVYQGLNNMSITGQQSSNALFETTLSSNESVLLFNETSSYTVPRGIGVWRKPAGGGTYNDNGGNLVFISGRPYRYNSNQLRNNIEFIFENFLGETSSSGLFPKGFILYQNFPNPFNPTTTISYRILEMNFITLELFDVLGNKLTTLVNEEKSTGFYNAEFDGRSLSSGVYFYKLQVGNFSQTKKMVLMK